MLIFISLPLARFESVEFIVADEPPADRVIWVLPALGVGYALKVTISVGLLARNSDPFAGVAIRLCRYEALVRLAKDKFRSCSSLSCTPCKAATLFLLDFM